jgi:aminoglycoside phosphotransferase (APT) family kinase protein
VADVSRLHGGLTAAMDLITLARGDAVEAFVLRRWYVEDAAKEHLVERESAALTAVQETSVPAPRLVAADPDGMSTGTRCTLTTALRGTPDLAPADPGVWVGQLAEAQASIHAVDTMLPTRWNGWYDVEEPLRWIADTGLREEARAVAAGAELDHQVGLVHGDYQHFNVLWLDGRLTGVVDWPNAGTGPRGIDVGHCRLNLAVLFTPDLADDYLAAYERASGVRIDPRVELRSVLNFDEGWPHFIPRQVNGRAPVDGPGMPARVTELVRRILLRT